MTTIDNTSKRLALLTKPLHLFIEDDVDAGVVLRYQAMEEWKRCGLYYVAELLAGRCDVSFMPVYRFFKDRDLSKNLLSPIESELPIIDSGNPASSYAQNKEQIEDVLLSCLNLWEPVEYEPEDIENGRTLNIHIEEKDLTKSGLDFETVKALFLETEFQMEFTALVKEYAKNSTPENNETPA